MSSTVSRDASGLTQGSDRALMRLTAALFLGFLCFGLPLPVIPIFVKHSLGFGDVAVGVSVGIQFLATVATRSVAGRQADSLGGRRTMLRGSLICASAGGFYALAAFLPLPSALKLAVLIVGRLAAGLGESQLVTGTLAWAIATAGPQRAGKAISWTGMAMYGALAAGAPAGMALFHSGGFLFVAGAAVLAPLLAGALALGVPACEALAGERVPLLGVLATIWRGGISLSLQGVGFATIGAFASLYFASRGWPHAGLAMSCFGGAFVLMRVLFGHVPDRIGGYPVAMTSMLIECIGQALLWLAPNEMTALAGALVTGLGCSLVFPSLGIEALKTIPPHSRGTAMGGFIAFQDVAYGATGPVTGVLASRYGYTAVFLVGAIAAMFGIGMALAASWHAATIARTTP
jgi:MFS family permease